MRVSSVSWNSKRAAKLLPFTDNFPHLAASHCCKACQLTSSPPPPPSTPSLPRSLPHSLLCAVALFHPAKWRCACSCGSFSFVFLYLPPSHFPLVLCLSSLSLTPVWLLLSAMRGQLYGPLSVQAKPLKWAVKGLLILLIPHAEIEYSFGAQRSQQQGNWSNRSKCCTVHSTLTSPTHVAVELPARNCVLCMLCECVKSLAAHLAMP